MGYGSGYPAAVESLIDALRQLPGIGRRGAERLALAMLEWEPERQRQLGELVAQLSETVSECPECGALADAGELCAVCRRSDRDPSQICVVETMAQLLAIEASGNYRGRYHVRGDEWFLQGHFPGAPVVPGVRVNRAKWCCKRTIRNILCCKRCSIKATTPLPNRRWLSGE